MTAELATTHPLDAHAPALTGLARDTGGGLSVQVLPTAQSVTLRLDPAGPARAGVDAALGTALPTRPNTWAAAGDGEVVWLGPDEWLVTSRSPNAAVSEAALRELVAGEAGGAAVDTSAQRVVLRIGGRLARELLSFGCSLDLHPRSFPAGRSAQTLLGGAGVILLARDAAADADGGAVLDVHVRSSFAGHLADWLLDAALEFRPDPAADPAASRALAG
ncbi:sarcosine oxidase subunit gamma [Pseudonocardia sp. ICBG601]|uniref:sarcosine oxidase subunit gamma n=1 Tax=Pseudonocardia sp. ICBG601 TaxID=2846759 RepID=UPI001CF64337|nr:sarcosine oxidase subunit gamma family protein [Pseudonocardia sp. ICBG601]